MRCSNLQTEDSSTNSSISNEGHHNFSESLHSGRIRNRRHSERNIRHTSLSSALHRKQSELYNGEKKSSNASLVNRDCQNNYLKQTDRPNVDSQDSSESNERYYESQNDNSNFFSYL